MKRTSARVWVKDKKALIAGVLLGALAVGLLWFVSANTQTSIFKLRTNTKTIETVAPTETSTGVIETRN
ncbi:MAG: hypothetical protein AAB383_02050 [Patescibacteria group bacterium]